MDATRSRQHLSPSLASFGTWLGRFDRRRLLGVPIAPATGALVALVVSLLFLEMPINVLESMSTDSGIAALVAAAAPPLGLTARLSAALLAAITAGGVVWFGLFLVLGARTVHVTRDATEDGVPVLRRADAHPDAPARRPVFANSDLGTPFLEVKAAPDHVLVADPGDLAGPTDHEWSLPTDLDTPLATYLHPSEGAVPHAAALPIVHGYDPARPSSTGLATSPLEPAPSLEAEQPAAQRPDAGVEEHRVVRSTPLPIAHRFAADERIETIELTPTVLATASIHDLLDRLERGVARKQTPPSPAPLPEAVTDQKSLEDTLEALRALARRVG